MLTYEELKKNRDIREYIQRADESLIALGYTEHSFAHVGKVAANGRSSHLLTARTDFAKPNVVSL